MDIISKIYKDFPIIYLELSTKDQFIEFCKKNNPKDMETAFEFFTVFGGLDIKLDTTKPLMDEIKKHILEDYNYLKEHIHNLTGGYGVDHAILTGIAQGDRRINSSFKRAHVSFEEGSKCIEKLIDREIIEKESSANFLLNKRGNSKVSAKLLFTTPFLRFWFAFISPIYKGIKEGEFKEFNELYENRKNEFPNFILEELAIETLIDSFVEDKIDKIGKYWDENNEISIVAKTKSGKIIAGLCKNTSSKLKKSELTNLKNICKNIDLKVDSYILFTKKGFSNELKDLKSNDLKLFTLRNLKILVN